MSEEVKEKERATLISLRNTMDKISGNLYETKSNLNYIVHGRSKDESDGKDEERESPTLEALQSQLDNLLGVAHDCQVLVSDIRS